jgi:hypothetical protein
MKFRSPVRGHSMCWQRPSWGLLKQTHLIGAGVNSTRCNRFAVPLYTWDSDSNRRSSFRDSDRPGKGGRPCEIDLFDCAFHWPRDPPRSGTWKARGDRRRTDRAISVEAPPWKNRAMMASDIPGQCLPQWQLTFCAQCPGHFQGLTRPGLPPWNIPAENLAHHLSRSGFRTATFTTMALASAKTCF